MAIWDPARRRDLSIEPPAAERLGCRMGVPPDATLAKQLGVSQPVVARLERGDHTPTWETLARLARTMGVEFLVEVHPTAGARLRQVS